MEQVNLPTKTKIAAWMIIFQGISPFLCLVCEKICVLCTSKGLGPFLRHFPPLQMILEIVEFLICSISGGGFLLFYLFLIFGFFLLKKKRWAWYLSLLGLSISIITTIILCFVLLIFRAEPAPEYGFYLIFSFPLLIPFIAFVLIFLDRKNFWKIAS